MVQALGQVVKLVQVKNPRLLVPGEQEVRTGEAEYTGRICVIGSQLKEDALEELFGL